MQSLPNKQNELLLTLKTENLSPVQIRILKNIHSLLGNVLTCEDESEYFEVSSELIKRTAELIKNSSFPSQNKKIPYGDQAVEFAVDNLNESLECNSQNLDN